MERGKKSENIIGRKVNGESKIPKSAKCSSTKETSSKTSIEKKTARSSKTVTKIAPTTSSKLKQTQTTNLPRNVKRISIAKISKDIMNHFQDENLKSEDHAMKSTAGVKVLDKENATKQAPPKKQFSQASQKTYRSLPKRSSAPDLKQCTAFGGMRFTKKSTTSRKFGIFQNMTKESKDSQAVNHSVPCTEELKRSTSAKAIGIKEIEWSYEGNLKDPPTVTTEASKVASLTAKQATLKTFTAFGGIRFKPKWHSTPLKPDLFENMPKVSKNNKEIYPPGSTVQQSETIPNSAETITNKVAETITTDETVELPTKEANGLKPVPITTKELGDKLYPAFGGMRLTPKRKSTRPKPDIFKIVQEEPNTGDPESHFSDSEQLKMSSGSTKALLKSKTRRSHAEMLEQTSTQNERFSETVSITVKETTQVTAFGGIRFTPKWKSTPIRPNIFESIQKETKTDCLESHPTELKTIPASTTSEIKARTDEEMLQLLKTQNPESLKNDEASKNMKKVVPPAFGGLRFKPSQKKLHDVFEAQKSKVDNQVQF